MGEAEWEIVPEEKEEKKEDHSKHNEKDHSKHKADNPVLKCGCFSKAALKEITEFGNSCCL